MGSGIYSKNSDQQITNNIIAYSKRLVSSGTEIIRTIGTWTSAQFHYSSGILVGETCWQRFENIGSGGDITISIPGKPDTTIYINDAEKYELQVYFGLRQTLFVSTVNVKIFFEEDSLVIPISLGAEYLGTGAVYFNSLGTSASGGIVAVEGDSSKVYNCSFYDNEDGNYFTKETNNYLFAISTINENINLDPKLNLNEYTLSETSPCIDRGQIDTTGLNLPAFDINNFARILDGDQNGSSIIDIGACEYDYLTSIEVSEFDAAADKFQISQNYPNPFNPLTKIKYSILKKSHVTLKVFDVLGSEVHTLISMEQPKGSYKVEFDGSDLASGIYFYRIQADNFIDTKKMMLMK